MELTRFTAAGYTWSVTDSRNAADAKDMYRKLATITPIDADGNRVVEVTINGATRRSVFLSARRHPAIGVQVWAESGDLTDKARRVIITAAEAACKDIPDLTADEITAGLVDDMANRGNRAGYTAYRESGMYTAHESREAREAAVVAATAAFEKSLRGWLKLA